MRKRKRQDIEFLRVLGAFGIVWYHAEVVGQEYAYAALVVFLILSAYLSGTGGRPPDLAQVRHRFVRLIVPWVVWWAIYGVVNFAYGKPVIQTDHGWIAGLLAGPSSHLWYMPFVFGNLLLLDVVKAHVPVDRLAVGCAVLALLMLGLAPVWSGMLTLVGYPLAQFIHSFAGVQLGIFLRHIRAPARWLTGLLLLAILVGEAWLIPCPGVGLPYLIGTLVTTGLILTPLPDLLPRFDITPLSECTLGIYFVHMLILAVNMKLDLAQGCAGPVLVFVVSTVLVMAGRQAFPRWAACWS